MRKISVSLLCAAVLAGAGGLALADGTHAGTIAPPAFTDIAGDPAEGALTLLAAMGVYTGEAGLGGPVHPADPITRAQFCKVVVVAMGWGRTATALSGLKPNFTDSVPSWAWGYVNVAYYRGIIKGYEDGSFRAGNPVSYAEALAMLVRAVPGHESQVLTGPGLWPLNYIFYAIDAGFAGDVDVAFTNLPATRGDVARMLVAAMQIDRLNKDGGKIAGSAVLAGHVFAGVMKGRGEGHVIIGAAEPPLANLVYLVGATSYEGLRNLMVLAVTNEDDDCFFIQVLEDSTVAAGVFEKLGDRDGDKKLDCLVFADGAKVPYPEDVDWDGDMVDATLNEEDGFHESDLEKGDECVVTLDEAGLAVYVVALRFGPADWVEKFKAAEPAAKPPKDTWVDLHDRGGLTIPEACQVTVNGAQADRDDLKVYDCVYLAFRGDDEEEELVAVRAVRQTVEGTVYSTSVSYPGEIHRVTIDKAGGGRQTYVIDLAGGVTEPRQGAAVKYGLNALGQVYVPIGYADLTPYVVVRTYTVDGSGHRTATFDIRGKDVTYRLGPEPDHPTIDLHEEAEGQVYGRIKVNPVTGVVTEWEEIQPDEPAEVVAVDPVHGNMTLRYTNEDDDLAYAFIDDPNAVVYAIDSHGDKVYVGFAGLAPGDRVLADDLPDGVVFEETEK